METNTIKYLLISLVILVGVSVIVYLLGYRDGSNQATRSSKRCSTVKTGNQIMKKARVILYCSRFFFAYCVSNFECGKRNIRIVLFDNSDVSDFNFYRTFRL